MKYNRQGPSTLMPGYRWSSTLWWEIFNTPIGQPRFANVSWLGFYTGQRKTVLKKIADRKGERNHFCFFFLRLSYSMVLRLFSFVMYSQKFPWDSYMLICFRSSYIVCFLSLLNRLIDIHEHLMHKNMLTHNFKCLSSNNDSSLDDLQFYRQLTDGLKQYTALNLVPSKNCFVLESG